MKRKGLRRNDGWKLGMLCALCAVAAAAYLAAQVGGKMSRQELAVIEQQVRSAAASCYACEGRFPQQLSYLVENYGLVYDQTRYHVVYDAFASNIMPDIDVNIRGEEKR